MQKKQQDQSQIKWVADFIWNIADDRLRDVYVRGKYRDVILPFTVRRRLDASDVEANNYSPLHVPAGQVDVRGWQPAPDDIVTDDDLVALGDEADEPEDEDDGEES